jgi:hypothetical protein
MCNAFGVPIGTDAFPGFICRVRRAVMCNAFGAPIDADAFPGFICRGTS